VHLAIFVSQKQPGHSRCLTVVGRIFLAADQQFWVEELPIWSCTNFVDWRGVKVDEDASWNMLAIASFSEECLIRANIDGCVGIRLSVRQQTMLQKVQLPG
jgi:hypothetical protein